MSDLTMEAPKGNFDPHPPGPCMAVCRDIWSEVVDNPKAGQTNKWGNVEPEKNHWVHFEFLTDEPIEINGQLLPRLVFHRVSKSWGEKSNCRKFIGGWDPAAGKLDKLELDDFVGRGAYLNIVQNTSNGKTYANIATIAAPPKGSSIPKIPADFVRHKDRPVEGPAPVATSADRIPDPEGTDVPF